MNKADLYHEAFNAHRHYDSLSVATVSLLAAVIGGTLVRYKNIQDLPGSFAVFALGAVLIYLTLQIYGRFDRHASVALNVAALLETEQDASNGLLINGFAYVFSHTQLFPNLDAKPGGRIYSRIKYISLSIVAIYTGIFIYLLRQVLVTYF